MKAPIVFGSWLMVDFMVESIIKAKETLQNSAFLSEMAVSVLVWALYFPVAYERNMGNCTGLTFPFSPLLGFLITQSLKLSRNA